MSKHGYIVWSATDADDDAFTPQHCSNPGDVMIAIAKHPNAVLGRDIMVTGPPRSLNLQISEDE
jgi:hypothetical protein